MDLGEREWQVGHVAETVPGGHDVHRRIRHRQGEHVADRPRRAIRRPRLGARERHHPVRDVDAEHGHATARGLEGNVPGAAREVQPAPSGLDTGEIDQPRLPSSVAPERQESGDEIVAIRDRRKQPPDVLALGVGCVKRVRQPRRHCGT